MKLAFFGGTFDPVHKAHLTVAREAADEFGLDRVLFVPAANPPHKPDSTWASYENRYRMVELASSEDQRFSPSRLEEGAGKSYSIDTIERLRETLRPDDELFFLIGADAFAEVGTWHRWRDVLNSVEFIVVTRPGHDVVIPAGARARLLTTLALPVSSSDIRQKLASGHTPEELPKAVYEYIRSRGLYR